MQARFIEIHQMLKKVGYFSNRVVFGKRKYMYEYNIARKLLECLKILQNDMQGYRVKPIG
jgi:hypothetical protein